MPEYKGATVKIITEIVPLEGADRVELAKLGKYQTVVPKGKHAVGERVIFIECDSVLPPDAWADEYRKYVGKRVKIVKMRGTFSEGIVAPLSTTQTLRFNDGPETPITVEEFLTFAESPYHVMSPDAQVNVSRFLNVTHYESAVEAEGGIITTPMPGHIPKTNEERWEALEQEPGRLGLPTLKIDGMSLSFYPEWIEHREEDWGLLEWHIYGREREFPLDQPSRHSVIFYRYCDSLLDMLDLIDHAFGTTNVVFRGEMFGQGIQGNQNNAYAKQPLDWALFNVYDLNTHTYLPWDKVVDLAEDANVPTIPTYEFTVIDDAFAEKVQTGKFLDEPYEGVVVKYPDGSSFKILSKPYDGGKGE